MNEIKVKVNPAYMPYLKKEQDTQIFFGGSSSGKSFFLAQKVVLDNLNGVNWLVCRNVANTIDGSVFNEIVSAINEMGIRDYYKINRSIKKITCVLNDKQIVFGGLDNDGEKIKSIKPVNGVIERIFVEEATEMSRAAYKQLTKRIRGQNSSHKKFIVLAFNPILKSHWIYKEFFGSWDEGRNAYESEKELLIVKTTYKDNLFLTEDDVRRLENESDPYYYNVYSLGNWGVLGHVIFKNWRTEDLSLQIDEFDNIYNGLDFGYASDPNAGIKLHLDKKHRRIYVIGEFYKAGMSDEELALQCLEFAGDQYISCDSAEPKTIDFLSNKGIRAVAAAKGKDSIARGIRWLMDYEIIVDTGCQNFKNEIEQYHWLRDKYGNAMAKPADKNNHLLDALRYALWEEILSAEVRAGKRL